MEEYTTLISQVGFPIAISVWLLFDVSKSLKENIKKQDKIIDQLSEVRKTLDELCKK